MKAQYISLITYVCAFCFIFIVPNLFKDATLDTLYTYINLEKPDNKWYYLVNDVGEQVIFGNFTEKVTITALKYSDELNVAVKGVQLSDEAGEVLSEAVKHADEISDATKNSDELGEVVEEALTKHVDEVGEVASSAAKTFDDVLEAVEHPEYFREGALEHIFKGNGSGGFHYEGLGDANGKVLEILDGPDMNGVYSAKIEVSGMEKKIPNTFFPKDWSIQKVIETIEEAYNNKVWDKRNVYNATTSSGIKIEMYLDTDGKIVTAYPLINLE